MLTSASLHLRDFLVAIFWSFVEGSLRKKIGKKCFSSKIIPFLKILKELKNKIKLAPIYFG